VPAAGKATSGRGRNAAAAAAADASVPADPAPVSTIDDDPKWRGAEDFPTNGCLPVKDEALDAATAAAGLRRLAPGPGLLRQEAAGVLCSRAVDCREYVLGQPTGHHAKLYRQQVRGGGRGAVRVVQMCCRRCSALQV
jgi:hypothetical protein